MKPLIKLIDQKGLSIYILLMSDALWFFISFLSAYYFRNQFGLPIQEIQIYLRVIPWILLLLIGIFYIYGLYEKKNRVSQFSELYLICKATTVCLILIMAGSFMEKYEYSRGLVLLFWGFSLIFLNFGRLLIRIIKTKMAKKGYGIINVLIIGAGKHGKTIAQSIEEYHDFGYKIKGFLDDYSRLTYSKYPNFGATEKLIEIIKKNDIHEIFIADPAMAHNKILEMMQSCENINVKFKVAVGLFEIVAGSIDISEIEGIPALNLNSKGNKRIYHFIKRILDVFLSIISLIILMPFWLIILILIKIDSQGKAVFSQERVGENGKIFKMYKFRTMYKKYSGSEIAPESTNDKRITKFGKFLRKTSLDETPQLINVLKGEMSIVGPRPEMPFIVEKYSPWQKKRLDAKPGLTGLWQVLGRKNLPLADNLEYDFYYIKNQSLLLDLVIIFKTIIILLTKKGAY